MKLVCTALLIAGTLTLAACHKTKIKDSTVETTPAGAVVLPAEPAETSTTTTTETTIVRPARP